MQNAITALTEELRRLKATGVKTVLVSDESLAQLRAARARTGSAAKPATVVAAKPAIVLEPAPTRAVTVRLNARRRSIESLSIPLTLVRE